jgi:phenylalanyl-tRNA synthetase alpha chain
LVLEQSGSEPMIEEIELLKKEADQFEISEKNSLEEYRLKFLSRNGLMNKLFENFKLVPNEQKKNWDKKSTF